MNKKRTAATTPPSEGLSAHAEGVTLRGWTISALPIVNQILNRVGLEALLEEHLAADGVRMKIPTRRGILLMARNILLSR